MDDLRTVRVALEQDEPAREVADRSRHRLQNRMRGRVMPRRTAWLAGGVTLTAAAAAVALVVVPSAPVPSPPDATTTTAAPVVSGAEVLLAAATVAEGADDGSGTYWHVRIVQPDFGYESWTKPNGESWFRGAKSGNEVVSMPVLDPTPFDLVGADMTLEQLRALPAEPAALLTAIETAIENGGGETSAGPLVNVPELFEQAKVDSLISLVSTLPAPPAVRAAAFRAIATYPGVRVLGAVPGGQGLLLPGEVRLVVDPATGRVNGTSRYVEGGGQYTVAAPDTAKIIAEWTDVLPS